jgi:competence protein ComEA
MLKSMSSSFLFLKNTFIKHQIQICMGTGIVGVLLFSIFIFLTFSASRVSSHQIEQEIQSQEIGSSQRKDAQCCLVEVVGAVLHPGVYQVPKESRVQDAILVAGGFSKELDTVRLAKEVQLVKKIDDGEKIELPIKSIVVENKVTNHSDQVSINTATETELDTLPGVGEKTVQKIIEHRPYQSVDDFFTKLKFSENQQLKLRELISK